MEGQSAQRRNVYFGLGAAVVAVLIIAGIWLSVGPNNPGSSPSENAGGTSPSSSAGQPQSASTDVPKITTPGVKFLGMQGLSVQPSDKQPVVAGQNILQVAATSGSPDGRHYLAMQVTGLKPNQTYRITAWVIPVAGTNVALQGRDQPDNGTNPPNNGVGLFDPAAGKVIGTEMHVDGSGVTDGPDGWKKVWIDLPTSDGQFVVAFFLLNGNSYTFSGGDQQLTFGGIEASPQS